MKLYNSVLKRLHLGNANEANSNSAVNFFESKAFYMLEVIGLVTAVVVAIVVFM
jgi:hypothetical protein